jgi:spermidine synthase
MIRYRFIKKADKAELAQLIAIYRQQGWWTRSDTEAMLRRIIKGSYCFLVAEEGGTIVGMGRGIDALSKEAYIHDVAVLRSSQGRDIGAGLVRRLVRRLRAGGARWVGLIASSNSAPFYRKLGFVSPASASAMMLGNTNV